MKEKDCECTQKIEGKRMHERGIQRGGKGVGGREKVKQRERERERERTRQTQRERQSG